MFKKLLILSAMTFALQAQAENCEITDNTANKMISAVLNEHGYSFDGYEQVCQKLKKANAAIVIGGSAGILGDISFAWAEVSLKDKNTMIFTNEYSGSMTKSNSKANMETAKLLLLEAINGAIGNVDFDNAIQSLNESRRQVKAAYSRK